MVISNRPQPPLKGVPEVADSCVRKVTLPACDLVFMRFSVPFFAMAFAELIIHLTYFKMPVLSSSSTFAQLASW